MKFFRAIFIGVLVLAIAAGAGLWWFGPGLMAPQEAFAQGPGGAVAYISLSNQLRTQTDEFWTGQDVRITMNQEEFSGMLASAILSGRSPSNPIAKVRAYLPEGELQVQTVLELPYSQVPQRFRNHPVGLVLDLAPAVSAEGEVLFRIVHAQLGKIPIPVSLIKWAGQRLPLSVNGYDAREATIELPIGDLIANNFGRNISIKQFTSSGGNLTLVMSLATGKK